MNNRQNTYQRKRLFAILLTATTLLCIPLIAMLFTTEVDWTALDFAVMGILLFGTGLLCEFVLRKIKNTGHRLLLCGVILLAFFLIWAELAVLPHIP
jgi:hypothetical protein